MVSALSDRDYGYAALLKRVFGIRKPVVEVGVLDKDAGKSHGGGATVLDIALWNEFGTDRIPARSFIRAWFDESQQRLRDDLVKLLQPVISGKRTADQALELLGLRAVGQIQERIAAGIEPPNAPATVKRKGSSTPLVDTGQLRSSISHRVTED